MIRQNIIANLVGRAWGVASVYLFVPLYLKFLGPEGYGLVGFYATLAGVLSFADMGLTATLNREMARLSVLEDSEGHQAEVLRTYETIYIGISLAVALTVWFLAPLIAHRWLRSGALDPRSITSGIRLMGVSIAIQFPANLYLGGLMGLQRQILSNLLQIGYALARGVGAVLILWLLSPTVVSFFSWQVIVDLAYCLATRVTLWRAVPRGLDAPRFNWLVVRSTWRYATGMLGMAFLSTVLFQADKIAVSRLLPLATFGYYMLAVALAAVPRMLASPIGVAVFPRFTGLVTTDDRTRLVRDYHRTAAMVAIAVIPGGLTLAAFSGDVLLAWTGNPFAAQQVALVSSLLVGGEVLQALTVPAYYLILAHGNVRLVLQVQVASVVFLAPVLVVLVSQYGIVGAGMSWAVVNLCTFPPYMYFAHRRFLPGQFRRWLLQGVGRPLAVGLLCVLVARWLAPHFESRLLSVGLVGSVWVIATMAIAATIADLRFAVMSQARRVLGGSGGAN